jgi:hypothetical protein
MEVEGEEEAGASAGALRDEHKPDVVLVALPFVFRYLVNELGAFSIRCRVHVERMV